MTKAAYVRNESVLNVEHNRGGGNVDTSKSVHNAVFYLSSNDVILDIECGKGNRTCDLACHVKHVTGIDLSKESVNFAKWRAEQAGLTNTRFEIADLNSEYFQAQKFDAIIADDITNLSINPAEIMLRLNSLLVPGGKLILNTPCLGEGKSFIRNVRALLSGFRLMRPCHRFCVAKLENLVTNSNFNIIEADFLSQASADYFIVAEKQ